MINNIVFEGNLTRDPEIKFFPNGDKYAILQVANSKKYKKQNGEERENICFIEIRVFGKSVKVVEEYLKKGYRLITQGEINFDIWETDKGEKRSKHFIVARNLSIVFKSRDKEEDLEKQIQEENSTIQVAEEEIPF